MTSPNPSADSLSPNSPNRGSSNGKESALETNQEIFFEDLDLSDEVLDALYDMRFERCTPIQAACIPPILARRDVLGVAQTGTGKTAAYLLPLLTLLSREERPDDVVNCIVIAPTRELARQIDQALQGFAYYTRIHAVAVYGGNDGIRYEQERRSLQKGADIVLATPGRLLTHLQLGTFDLGRTTYLVLDEADRMLDMGFAEDILSIVRQMPTERQTILFSATMPEKIAELGRTIMRNPVEVKIASTKPAENILQQVYLCRENDKVRLLFHLFEEQPPRRVILFASSKVKVKELFFQLSRKGLNVRAMHSDLEQRERDEVMNLFRAHRVDLLVATDIVARGIDIDDISMVINFDIPRDAEDYVHRVGRTARAGKGGRAVTFVGERDLSALRTIEGVLKIKIERGALPEGFEPPHALERSSGSLSRGLKSGGKGRARKGTRVKGVAAKWGKGSAKAHGGEERPASKQPQSRKGGHPAGENRNSRKRGVSRGQA